MLATQFWLYQCTYAVYESACGILLIQSVSGCRNPLSLLLQVLFVVVRAGLPTGDVRTAALDLLRTYRSVMDVTSVDEIRATITGYSQLLQPISFGRTEKQCPRNSDPSKLLVPKLYFRQLVVHKFCNC